MGADSRDPQIRDGANANWNVTDMHITCSYIIATLNTRLSAVLEEFIRVGLTSHTLLVLKTGDERVLHEMGECEVNLC